MRTKVTQFLRRPYPGAYSIERIFEDTFPYFSDEITVAKYVNPYFSKGILARVLGILRAPMHQGDVNHITGDVNFLSFLMCKRRTMITVPDCVALEHLGGIKYKIMLFFWYWLPARRCALITTISESSKRQLEHHLGSFPCPVKIIPCCVSEEFKFSPKEFDSTCPRILQVGTKINKNLERVVPAIAGLSCHLVVIGSLTYEQRELLDSSGVSYENLLGLSRLQLLAEYVACDIVMFASLYEGFGLPILEAQAIGRPVITSTLYSMPEVAGQGAYYVDPYEIPQIRNAVEEITSNTSFRKRMIDAGLVNAEKYSPRAIARKYEDVYRSILN